jgi:tetratricopeptide (TPR) repeat protein
MKLNLFQSVALSGTIAILCSCSQNKSVSPVATEPADATQQWSADNEAGLQAMEKGNYTVAENSLEKAAKEAESFGLDDPRVAATLNNLASAYEKEGKLSKAADVYQRALPIMQKSLGENHTGVAVISTNLARVKAEQGDLDAAGTYYRAALAIREKNFGPDDIHVAESLNSLGDVYYKQGKYSMAEPLLKRTIVIRVRSLGKDHPLVADSLEAYAATLRKMNQEPAARKIESIARDIRTKKTATPTSSTET